MLQSPVSFPTWVVRCFIHIPHIGVPSILWYLSMKKYVTEGLERAMYKQNGARPITLELLPCESLLETGREDSPIEFLSSPGKNL